MRVMSTRNSWNLGCKRHRYEHEHRSHLWIRRGCGMNSRDSEDDDRNFEAWFVSVRNIYWQEFWRWKLSWSRSEWRPLILQRRLCFPIAHLALRKSDRFILDNILSIQVYYWWGTEQGSKALVTKQGLIDFTHFSLIAPGHYYQYYAVFFRTK